MVLGGGIYVLHQSCFINVLIGLLMVMVMHWYDSVWWIRGGERPGDRLFFANVSKF
jgi:hypothetical protein